tara:strand:- start:781 stop:1125 length:345 start_codon:yes stop_codon:yes gene_type:complete
MSRNWTPQEDALLLELVQEFGIKWPLVAAAFNKKSTTKFRSVDSVRNRWNRMHINLLCQNIPIDLFCMEVMTDIMKTNNEENIHDNTQDLPITYETYRDVMTTLEIEEYGTNSN